MLKSISKCTWFMVGLTSMYSKYKSDKVDFEKSKLVALGCFNQEEPLYPIAQHLNFWCTSVWTSFLKLTHLLMYSILKSYFVWDLDIVIFMFTFNKLTYYMKTKIKIRIRNNRKTKIKS